MRGWRYCTSQSSSGYVSVVSIAYCESFTYASFSVAVVLDVGTNNEELLANPDYVGIRKNRLEGDDYFTLVDEFMTAGGLWCRCFGIYRGHNGL